jgi:hypothetical protein
MSIFCTGMMVPPFLRRKTYCGFAASRSQHFDKKLLFCCESIGKSELCVNED